MSTPADAIKKTPRRLRKSLILDGIRPQDLRDLKMTFCCEQCSHFNSSDQSCSIGYLTEPHLRENQLKTYELTGKMAFCRFLEID